MSLEDSAAESGREPFDLGFDRVGHVNRRAVGDVTVGPGGVMARRSTRRVEEAGLREEHERAFRVLAAADGRLGSGDLLERATEVHGAGPGTIPRRPGDGSAQRPVELEDACTVSVSIERAEITGGQAMAGHRDELSGRDVEQDGAGFRQLVDRLDSPTGDDLASEGAQIGS